MIKIQPGCPFIVRRPRLSPSREYRTKLFRGYPLAERLDITLHSDAGLFRSLDSPGWCDRRGIFHTPRHNDPLFYETHHTRQLCISVGKVLRYDQWDIFCKQRRSVILLCENRDTQRQRTFVDNHPLRDPLDMPCICYICASCSCDVCRTQQRYISVGTIHRCGRRGTFYRYHTCVHLLCVPCHTRQQRTSIDIHFWHARRDTGCRFHTYARLFHGARRIRQWCIFAGSHLRCGRWGIFCKFCVCVRLRCDDPSGLSLFGCGTVQLNFGRGSWKTYLRAEMEWEG